MYAHDRILSIDIYLSDIFQLLFLSSDFQYMDGHKDQGMNVREKAKQLVALLKDDERLRNERARALKAKERFAQSVSGFGSDGLDTMSPVSSDVSAALLIIV